MSEIINYNGYSVSDSLERAYMRNFKSTTTGDPSDEHYKAVQSPTFKTVPEKAKLEELKQALFEKAHKCKQLAKRYHKEADGCDWELNRIAKGEGAWYMDGIALALEDIIIDCDLIDDFIDYKRARSFRKKGEE